MLRDRLNDAVRDPAGSTRRRWPAIGCPRWPTAVDRRQRLGALAGIGEMVAARPDELGGWDLTVIRFGRFAAAGRARRGVDPMPVVELLVASAETVLPGPGPLPGASAEETTTLLRWVERPGARLVRTHRSLVQPGRGGRADGGPFMKAADMARGTRSARGPGRRARPTVRAALASELGRPDARREVARHGDGNRAHRCRGRPDPGGRPGDRRPPRGRPGLFVRRRCRSGGDHPGRRPRGDRRTRARAHLQGPRACCAPSPTSRSGSISQRDTDDAFSIGMQA